MSAFVTGATGFVGREVVRQLAVRGTHVVAHIRPESRSLDSWRGKFGELGVAVAAVPWDAGALAQALRALPAGDVQLYICIGTTKHAAAADGLTGDIYQQVDLGLTQIAIAAAQQSGRSPRLVYLSSVGADATARSAYLHARGQAEDAVRGAGLPWVIARPSIITGDREDSRPGERAAAVVGDGLLAVARVFGGRKLRDTWSSTTPDVLASALIRIAEAPAHDLIASGADLR